MANKIDFSVATSQQIEAALCEQLERIRLSRNVTQVQLAAEAGVSPRTIGRLEKGQGVSLASRILAERAGLKGVFTGRDDRKAIENILRIGTSAGGARAKAIVAWNPQTNQFQSGQVDVEAGFEHWLMKFDGVAHNRDKEAADPMGYGKIEYAYHRMAVEAGIVMSPSPAGCTTKAAAATS